MLAATRRAPHCRTSEREARPRTDHQLAEKLGSPEAEEERSIHVSLGVKGRIHPVFLPVSKLLLKRVAGNGAAGAERGSWHRARSTERSNSFTPRTSQQDLPVKGRGRPARSRRAPDGEAPKVVPLPLATPETCLVPSLVKLVGFQTLGQIEGRGLPSTPGRLPRAPWPP